ncbi:unnamed protein product [Linum trigynum]|uniref:Uncharacterized protein n=1 Tax=Linum trigynum TaxID=586398 RepID=A0AAV2ENJ1_9ROSI
MDGEVHVGGVRAMGAFRQPCPSILKDAMGTPHLADSGSEGSVSGEESQNCNPSKGRVSQVVAACEVGLTIADEVVEQPMGGGISGVADTGNSSIAGLDAGKLDEY